ncbi:hypothetical protein VNI00_011541 [Paramarasmius palmivorus]|uniref:Enoyl reductase (ER) domain-containing protein n=1 Tax=Paramarasmius palmivorus TaxID=297713 RepID=A0AAW0CEM0_9AGAR
MPQQKALLLEKKQGPWVVGSREIETPKPGELLVKVQAAGLNPIDWKIQTYGIYVEDFPAILGMDVAGDVEEVGADVEGFEEGDRIPSKYSYTQVASLPLGFATATIGLFAEFPRGLGLNPTFDPSVQYKGSAALVIGGSSSVGRYVLQILKFSGFSTIIAYASSQHTETLLSLGATDIIDRNKVAISDLQSAVKNITTTPISVVYDAIASPDTQNAGYTVLADDGKMVLTAKPNVDNKLLVESKKLTNVFGSVYPEPNRPLGKIMYKNLTRWLEEGVFVPNPVEELPNGLAGIADGLERLKNNQVGSVKLVGKPQETA